MLSSFSTDKRAYETLLTLLPEDEKAFFLKHGYISTIGQDGKRYEIYKRIFAAVVEVDNIGNPTGHTFCWHDYSHPNNMSDHIQVLSLYLNVRNNIHELRVNSEHRFTRDNKEHLRKLAEMEMPPS